MAAVAPTLPAAAELDWRPDGYETWTWKVDGGYEMPNGSPVPDINVGYIAAGDANAPPVLLVHGFGASGFHWRRNIGALADAGAGKATPTDRREAREPATGARGEQPA